MIKEKNYTYLNFEMTISVEFPFTSKVSVLVWTGNPATASISDNFPPEEKQKQVVIYRQLLCDKIYKE